MLLQSVVLLLGLASLATAQWYGGYFPGYHPWGNYWGNPGYGYPGFYNNHYYPQGKLVFHGQYPGSCDHHPDGLYYVDDKSFAYCSGGKYTLQPCAEGSANPAMSYFHADQHYGLYDFCSVNLVARGYVGRPHDVPVDYAHEKEPVYEPEKNEKSDAVHVYEKTTYEHGGNGYDQKVYEPKGYEEKGYEQAGYDQKADIQKGYEQPTYEKPGYDQKDYEQKGYERKGYEQKGQDKKDGYQETYQEKKEYHKLY